MNKKELDYIRNSKTNNFIKKNGCISIFDKLKKYEILEVGSGEGRFSQFSGVELIKLDINNKNADILGDVRNIPFKKETFKVVIAQLLLDLFYEEELYNVGKELYRVLKKNGYLLVLSDEIPSLNGVIGELSKILNDGEYVIPIIKKRKGKNSFYMSFIEDIGFSVIKNLDKTFGKINALLNLTLDESLIIKNRSELDYFYNSIELITSAVRKRDDEYVKTLFRLHLQKPLNRTISNIIESKIIDLNEIYRLYAGEESKSKIKMVMEETGFSLKRYDEEFVEFEFNNEWYGVPIYCMMFEKNSVSQKTADS